MNRLFPTAALIVLFLAPFTGLQAGLTWERMTSSHEIPLGGTSLEIRLPFTNTGRAPVTVESIHTSCGCTAASLSKKVYAPGERGEITVVYDATGQVGPQQRMVTVYTSDKPSEPDVLTLDISIPELFEITPRLVYWRAETAADEKRVSVKLNPALTNPRVILADAIPDTITAWLVRVGEEPNYQLVITPASTASAFRATVRLQIEAEGVAPQIIAVYAQVR